jgi:hypothetical protein
LPDKPSLAVLPFQNMTGDVELAEACAGNRPRLRAGQSLDRLVAHTPVLARPQPSVRGGKGGGRCTGEAGPGQRKDDPDTLWMAGFTLRWYAGQHHVAAAAVDRALTLNPNSAPALAADFDMAP